jgi:hypothetical protein
VLFPTHLQRIIGPFPTPPQLFKSLNDLTNIRSASDGSFLKFQGFQGWLVAKLDNEVLIKGFGATDGRVEDVSSYRTEIFCNIATCTMLTLIRKVYSYPPPNIERVCDNQSAITATWKDENISVFENTKPDDYAAKAARNAIADIKTFFTVKLYWVKGHANKCGPPLSLQEEMNILTDGLATLAQTALPPDMRPLPDCLHFPKQQICIVIRQKSLHPIFPLICQTPYTVPNLPNTFPTKNYGPHLFSILSHGTLSKLHSTKLQLHIKALPQKQCLAFGAPTYATNGIEANSKNATYAVMKMNNVIMFSHVKERVP